jgi:NADH:ubiquinone oxidoreductase subunit H
MYCYVRNALPRVRLVRLVRSCYVFLLPCYLEGTMVVQSILLVLFIKRPPSKQPSG